MKRMGVKRWLAAAFAAALALPLLSCGGTPAGEEPDGLDFEGLPVIADGTGQAGEVAAAENETLRLLVDPADASVCIEDRETGARYPLAVPEQALPEALNGAQKMLLQSLLQVTAMDSVGKEFVVNSRVGSVNRGTFTIYGCEDGVILDYRFERESDQYAVPVRIRLTEDGFTAEVLFDGVREWGDVQISRIALLPSFGAQPAGTEGYMLIPDGSGALVSYDAAVGNPADYYGDVYGRDPSLSLVMQTEVRQEVRLPVFGAKAGEAAFLGIIAAGDAGAAVHCTPAKASGEYGRVYASFVYRQPDTSILADKDWNSREVTVMAERRFTESPCVRYCLLSAEEADYSGMARRYRQYLTQEQGVGQTVGQPTLLLNMIGAYAQQESVLGFTVERSHSATTFEQAQEIINAFSQAGLPDLTVVYSSLNEKGRYRSQAGSFTPDDVLGGTDGLRALADFCGQQGVELIAELDVFSHYTKTDALFPSRFARRINDEPVKLYTYSPATNLAEEEIFRYLTRPDHWLSDWQAMTRIPSQLGLASYAPAGLGEFLYADHTNGQEKNRDDMKAAMAGLAAQMTEDGETRLLLGGANAYLLAYASGLRDVPVDSSAFDLQSESVPFYAMAVHGLLPLYSESLTGQSDLEDWGLRLAESGVMPQFEVTGSPSADFLNTEQNGAYASYYEDVLEQAQELLEWLGPLLEPVWDQVIVRHSRTDGLGVTEYENGVTIVTNYTQGERSYQGVRIPARSSCAVTAAGEA